ncbi:MAG: HDOD domain-containing protein [Candidatus Accumulibacter phosphatis]|nr:HDOD domain-containing protein [Candidatus Accumulibacter phosphatis]
MMTNQDNLMDLKPEVVRQGVRRLPSLPAVVVELLRSLDNEDADPRLLAMKLARDQALAAKVLRVANSSYYGLPGKVRTIGDAFAVIGLQGVRTLAVGAAISNVFAGRAGSRTGIWDFHNFWRHSMAVGLAAKRIARCGGIDEGHAFVAGLLHDIGRLALASCFPEHLAAVAHERSGDDANWLAVEQRVLGTDHAAIGKLLAEYWRFPQMLCEAIGSHHVVEGANSSGLVSLVQIADALGHAAERVAGRNEDERVVSVADLPLASYGLAASDWDELARAVSVELDAACAAFTV